MGLTCTLLSIQLQRRETSTRITGDISSQYVLSLFSVRAVINLEAAGTTGRELLFQATSEQMIEAYSHVPRPYGTVFANEIFSSGIILSEYVIP